MVVARESLSSVILVSLFLSRARARARARATRARGRACTIYGWRISHRIARSERVCSSGQYINLRQVSCEATLERRAEPYTIFVSTYAPGEEASFVLAVYSDRPVGLAPIDPEAVGVDG